MRIKKNTPRLKEMNQIVKEELEHISKDRGNLPQQLLRSHYQTTRMHSLGKKGKGESKGDVLKEVIVSVKRHYPDFDFEPMYDEDYFELPPQ